MHSNVTNYRALMNSITQESDDRAFDQTRQGQHITDARKHASQRRAFKKREQEKTFLSRYNVTKDEQKAYDIMHETLQRGRAIETYISNPKKTRHCAERRKQDLVTLGNIRRAAKRTVERCKIHRRRIKQREKPPSAPDASILRFLTPYPLADYEGREQYIPRIVNVVSVARTSAVPGTGTCLPLSNSEFRAIATRCTGAYYAPKRFSNIQLGYSFSHPTLHPGEGKLNNSQPRARVLVFQTGQIVTTGTNGISSTRLVVNLALEQLAKEANIHLAVDQFEVKNIVGSCSLGATFNCQGFADKHSENTSYDRWTFAGMVRHIRSWCSRVHTIPFNVPVP